MTDEELIARLRKYEDDLLSIAADRIEALIAEQSNLVVAAHRQGYDQARAVSSELRRAMAERIMEHEAKLAKAVEALEDISGNGNAAGRNPQLMADKAAVTIAKIKGETK